MSNQELLERHMHVVRQEKGRTKTDAFAPVTRSIKLFSAEPVRTSYMEPFAVFVLYLDQVSLLCAEKHTRLMFHYLNPSYSYIDTSKYALHCHLANNDRNKQIRGITPADGRINGYSRGGAPPDYRKIGGCVL